jgi:GST-like protein
VLNWLFWQMGSTPYIGGGFGHFYHYAPVKIEYAINRFAMEAKRQLDVLNRHLEKHEHMAGDEYSIADMAIWPWYGGLVQGTQYDAGEFLQGAGVRPRHALDKGDRGAARRQAGADGQPRRGRSRSAAARTP